MTNAEWTAEIAKALAAREKLRRAHNATGETVADAKGKLRPDRRGEWDRYRSEGFLPASRRIEARICELRDDIPTSVLAQARRLVEAGKLVPPTGKWAERMALLEAASVAFGLGDAESELIVPANCAEAIAPDQATLDAADIAPQGTPVALPPDPAEDYTGYTKQDANGRYTVAANQLTVTGLTQQEDAWLYKDRGANHFDGFSHNVDAKQAAVLSYGGCDCWGLSNVVEDAQYWHDNYSAALDVPFSGALLYMCNRETRSYSGQAITTGVPYYLTISRAAGGTTVTLYIYTDAARTSLLASKSVSVAGANKYRYLFGTNSVNSGVAGRTISALLANLDIGEAAAARTPWHLFFRKAV